MFPRNLLAVAVLAATSLAGAASAQNLHGLYTAQKLVVKPSVETFVPKPKYTIFNVCPPGWIYVGPPLAPQVRCQPPGYQIAQ